MKKGSVHPKVRNGLMAVLDVGTTKNACFIARVGGGGGIRVIGVGHQVSQGVRCGTIIDMDAAEAAIRGTVEVAETMAGENIEGVVVNLSASELSSRLVAYEVAVNGHEIGEAELRHGFDPAVLTQGQPKEHELVHATPVGYSIDGHRGIRDPRGMFGDRLGVNLHVVSANTGPLRNLATCVAHCHLEIEDRVLSPFASALACLVEDEKQLGVTLIDLGGGCSSIAAFFDGEMVYADSIPIGGMHVTTDIARGLSTPLSHAERIKTLYGSALPSPSDDREILKVPLVGEETEGEVNQVPRSMLVGIIRPRIEETFELVRARLEAAGFDKVAGRRVVLTGGASQLPGARELAGMILDKQVRLGRPKPIPGLAEATAGPAFSVCAGLLHHATRNGAVDLGRNWRPEEVPNGRFGRLGQWFRENF